MASLCFHCCFTNSCVDSVFKLRKFRTISGQPDPSALEQMCHAKRDFHVMATLGETPATG